MSSHQPHTESFTRDAQHFEGLYTQYWKKVYAVCYNQLKNKEVAQGIVQDIFVSLWERRETVSITSSLEHYLVRAAKLKVFEYLRNQATQQKHLERIRAEVLSGTRCTEYEVEYEDLNAYVQILIEQISEHGSRVFHLRGQGFSNKEIAHQLALSEKAVEYHVTKVLQFLRAQWSAIVYP